MGEHRCVKWIHAYDIDDNFEVDLVIFNRLPEQKQKQTERKESNNLIDNKMIDWLNQILL